MRSIERVLGEKIECRTLTGFDYEKKTPARDTEFARPPREPQRRREQKKTEPSRSRMTTAPKQKGHQARRTEAWSPHSSQGTRYRSLNSN